jgi:hypothetical protein
MFHEALIQIDALNEAAAQDLGLEHIYKRSALINAIKKNIETERLAEELQKSEDGGYKRDIGDEGADS